MIQMCKYDEESYEYFLKNRNNSMIKIVYI